MDKVWKWVAESREDVREMANSQNGWFSFWASFPPES